MQYTTINPLSATAAFMPDLACVAAGTGPGTIVPNVGNNQYTVGFFPWQHDSVYARNIDVTTGLLTIPGQCYLINDPSTAVDYAWDFNQSLAMTNCSNTGRDLMCMWFDGTAMQYKYSTPNVMAFRNGKSGGQGEANAMLSGKLHPYASISPAIAPVPAKSQIALRGIDHSSPSTVRDLQGRSVLTHPGGDVIDISSLSPGMYTISSTSLAGESVTLKFTKL